MPGNFFWEDLFEHSPDAKVILTVRESGEKWKRSFTNFMTQEYERFGNPFFWIFTKISDSAIFGPKMATQELNAMRALTKAMPGRDRTRKARRKDRLQISIPVNSIRLQETILHMASTM